MSSREPDIIRTLREEERLGKLRGHEDAEGEDSEGVEEPGDFCSICCVPQGGQTPAVNLGDPAVLYQTIFENSAVAITLTDENERLIRWNSYAEQLLGRSRDDLWMQPVKNLYPAEEWAKIRFQNIRQRGITHHLETRMLHKNRECIDVDLSLSVLKDQLGNVIGSIGIIKDVTQAKTMEKALQRSEETFKQLYEKAPVLYHTLSPKGEITNINEQWSHALGYEKADVLGKYIFDFIVFSERDEAQRSFQAKIASKQQYSQPSERTYLTKTGEERVFLIRDFLSFDEYHKVLSIQTTMEDITDRKNIEKTLSSSRDELERCVEERTAELVRTNVRLHQETIEHEQIETALELTLSQLRTTQKTIQEQNRQLRKLDQLKTNFLNVTSHELRTPMAAIKGFVQIMQQRMIGEITEEQEKGLTVVLRNIDRLDHLVQDIMDISRLESGTMTFAPEPIAVSDLIAGAVETVKPAASLKHITITADCTASLPALLVDKIRITQVLANLLNNAIKFSPERTAINIRVKPDKEDVLFEVEDHGRGIPADKLEKIFEIFYQVDSGLDRKFGGTGLGLPISRGIILGHGGRIWAESTVGTGSILRFTLPITPPQGNPSSEKETETFSDG